MFPVIAVAAALLLVGFLFFFGMYLMRKLDSFLKAQKDREDIQGEDLQ